MTTTELFKKRNDLDQCGYCANTLGNLADGKVATTFGYSCRRCARAVEPDVFDGRTIQTGVIPAPKPYDDRSVLPVDSAARKAIPMARGLLDYFPAALAAVANVSQVANEQHNPGEPIHHARGKSGDHADCIARHLIDRGTVDSDGLRHSAKVAWRALALLQEELEREEGAPLPRGAKAP